MKMINLKQIDAQNGRFYKDKEGNYYPSVTTKIQKVLATGIGLKMYFANKASWGEAQKHKNKRAEEGKRVHAACENLVHGETVKTDELCEDSIKRVQGFIKFWEKYEPKLIDTEFMVLCKKLKYGGTADLMVKGGISKGKSIIDIKTSKGIYESHKVQLMSYLHALIEMGEATAKTPIFVLALKHRTKKGWQLKEIEYHPEIVRYIHSIYNHSWFDRGDMIPKFKKKLPGKLEIKEELFKGGDENNKTGDKGQDSKDNAGSSKGDGRAT